MTERQRWVAGSGVIILLTLLAYLPSLNAAFMWDDTSYLSENPMIAAPDGLRRFWFTTEAIDYYPLTSTTWWLEWRLWGTDPMPYRLVNVFLHAAAALLLWRTLTQLSIKGGWFAALLFALHPVNVPSVAVICERKNVLALPLMLVALLFYLKFGKSERWLWYGLSLFFFILSTLAKSAVVMLPCVLLILAWWQRGRIEKHDFLRTAPFFALSLVMGLVTVWFQYNRALDEQPVHLGNFASRLVDATWAVWFYLAKALFPFGLNMIYPKQNFSATTVTAWLPMLNLVIFSAVCWKFRRTWGKHALAGLGCFIVMLFPVLGFFSQGFYEHSLVADWWQYFSLPAAVALVVAMGHDHLQKLSASRSLSLGIASVLAILFFAMTWTRSNIFSDEEKLWRDTVERDPESWAGNFNLGYTLEQRGKAEAAIPHYQRAMRTRPDRPEPFNNLGDLLRKQGKTAEALPLYERAVEIAPNYILAHVNLANLLYTLGEKDRAIRHYKIAMRIKPDSADARSARAAMHNNLAWTAAAEGDYDEAVRHYEIALEASPDAGAVHHNYAMTLLKLGHDEQAIAHLRLAVRLLPNFPDAQFLLGKTLSLRGNFEEALAVLLHGFQSAPKHLGLANELAWLYATCPKEKIRDASRALRLAENLAAATKRQSVEILDTLAAAHAESGQYEQAQHVAEGAITLAQKQSRNELIEPIQKRLQLYRQNKPFRASLR